MGWEFDSPRVHNNSSLSIYMLNILKTYYGFLARKKIFFGLFIVSLISGALLGSILPYFYKLFVDALPSLDGQKLMQILGIYIAVRVAGLVVSMISYTLGAKVVFGSAVDARTAVFKRVQDLDFAFHTSKSTGSLISAVKRGDGAYFNIFHTIHFRIINVLIEFLVMLAFLSSLDLRIGATMVVSVLALFAILKLVIGYNIRKRSEFNDAEDDVSGVIVDNFMNYETVKLFAKENWERKRLSDAFKIWMKRLWAYEMSYRVIDIGVGGIMTAGIFSTLFVSIRLAATGELDIGEFVLVAAFTASFYPQMFELVFGFREIFKNFVDIDKYFKIIAEEIKVKDPLKPVSLTKVRGEIEFNDVYFSYKGGQNYALRGINLNIRQGQSIALVGRSGSGKTTFTKALMRFYDIKRGKITIDGIDISRLTKQDLRSHMGVFPQEPILFNNTIGYNIKYAKPECGREELVAAAKMANIHEFIESMSEGYETNVGERGIKLSGGQKQRVAIARMILADPDIIIFDEATSHLDSESERLIQDAFWKAAKNKTTIVIAHRLSTVMKADKIVVLERGKIKEIGTHGELISREKSLYKHLWNLQTNN